jgi:hypothetical protein
MHTKIELQPWYERHLARWQELQADLELAKLPPYRAAGFPGPEKRDAFSVLNL